MKITTSKPVFEGENIIAYAEDTYIVFDDNGQGEIVIPNIERYGIKDGVRTMKGEGNVALLCPNIYKLNHKENTWIQLSENYIECSECGCKMDISNINGRATLEEAKNE